MKTNSNIGIPKRGYTLRSLLLVTLLSTLSLSGQSQTMSRSDRLFIYHGIQYQAWMGNGNGAATMPLGTEYSGLNLTAPTWFGGSLYSADFFAQFPSSKWSIEKGPYGEKNEPAPSPTVVANGFLSPDQASVADQLVSLGFGDEESYSNTLVLNHKAWISVSKAHYPNTLVHSNQWGSQWKVHQLRDYMTRAKPDFISYDVYLFRNTGDNGRRFRDFFNHLFKYRNLAFENTPGNGPINFGFYLQGFKKNGYTLSETQINGHTYLPLLFGAKWLNLFRYAEGNAFFYHNADGSLSPLYTYYSNIGQEIGNLSPHLSRLKSTKVTVVPGQRRVQGNTETLPIPSGASAWTSAEDRYITGVDATNLGALNNGLDGDVYIGYFDPVVGLDSTAGVTMAPIHHMDTEYFMIMNGLSAGNTTNSVSNPLGQAHTAQQSIRLSIDFGSDPVDTLKRINRTTGVTETIALTPVSGSQYYADIVLGGGKADLFYWENAHIVPSGNSVALNIGDSIQTGNVAELNSTSHFTIEAWVKFDNAISGWKNILGQQLNSTSRIKLWAVAGNKLVVGVANGQNSTKTTAVNAFSTGAWHHIAIAYNGAANNKIKLYVDGVLQSWAGGTGNIPSSTAANSAGFTIGGGLDGYIDDVRIWSSTLSQSTINTWKDKALGACHPAGLGKLKLYWKLDGSGTVADSGLGTSYTGTISSGGVRVNEGKATLGMCL